MVVTTLIVAKLHQNLQLLRTTPYCYFLWTELAIHANYLLYGSKVQNPDFPSQSLVLALEYYDYRLMNASSYFQHVRLMLFQFFAITTSFVRKLKLIFWLLWQFYIEPFQSSALIHNTLRPLFSQEEQVLQYLLSIRVVFLCANAKSLSCFVNQLDLIVVICGYFFRH